MYVWYNQNFSLNQGNVEDVASYMQARMTFINLTDIVIKYISGSGSIYKKEEKMRCKEKVRNIIVR